MLKLYKEIDGQPHYWQTWEEDEDKAFIYCGVVGQVGETYIVTLEETPNFREVMQDEILKKRNEGFKEFDNEDMTYLEIEYEIDGFGSLEDLSKRHRLERHLNNALYYAGLGRVDGGSIGGGTMEVGCLVVDFEVAKRIVENVLKHTEFNNYKRIFIL
jgi:hypothetical protein